jgi:hypothetical protein
LVWAAVIGDLLVRWRQPTDRGHWTLFRKRLAAVRRTIFLGDRVSYGNP